MPDDKRPNSPGRVTDAALTFARENGASMMSNLSAQARDNPLSFLLIGAGLALYLRKTMRNDGYHGGMGLYRDDEEGDLMRRTADPTAGFGYDADDYRQGRSASGRFSEAAGALRETAGALRDNVSERLSEAGDAVSSQASSLRDTVTGSISNMRDSYSETTDAVTARAADLRDRASEGISSARDTMSEMTERAGDYAEQYTERARSGIATLATEQPLVLGALGLLAGAAIAAMLPRTRVEQEYMGSTAQRLRDEARHSAEETYQRAKAAASKAVDKATEVASQEFAGQSQSDKPATGGPSSSTGHSSTGGTATSGAASLGITAGSGGARPTESISASPRRS
ncbi:MAG: hypothetical protein JWL62_3542 [Hyphomicrobiales bacterium]|nr:hypothetical protein [Hyphomicrobiales bacterium]